MHVVRMLLGILILLGPAWAQSDPFEKRDGCFLLVRLRDGWLVDSVNTERATERFSAGSSFELAAAVMAFDAGLITPKTVFRWNKVTEQRPECNQDQTPKSWLKHSVEWVTRQLTQKLGPAKVNAYLSRLNYGNADFSGGVQISAQEQTIFMGHLIARDLPLSRQAQDETVKILPRESGPGWLLEGQPGQGKLSFNRQLGWYVGHLRVAKGNYIVVMNISDKLPGQTQGPAGRKALVLSKRRLVQLGLMPSGESVRHARSSN